MSLTIGDIVMRNERAAITNDVQLQWYPHDPRNSALTAGYIWTAQAVSGYVPSITLLEKVRDAFLSEFNPNRFVIRATYGHGKSHLALAMANFFGKPAGSPEVQGVLENLSHTATAKGAMFRDFKTSHAPFLILRLRGDDMQSLPQQVVSGLETALHEQEATRDANLGLWFDKALAIFERMSDEQVQRASEVLGSHGYDVPSLRQKLLARDGSVYELCHTVIEKATGIPPHFGRAVDPGAAIEHVCNEWCGEDKAFAGLLVLFDEFSLFVEDYAKMRSAMHGAPLQSLLDGIANSRSKAAFVAFSQQDPDDNANLVFRRMGAGEEELQRVLKELTRLEKGNRYLLYSSMETVLDAYLKQDEKAWSQLLDNERIFDAMIDASDEVGRLFEDRYGEGMGWGAERVQKVMMEGCFPLHPLTTAILCSVPLRATDNTRSVMGFVLDALDRKIHAPAACDGVPNWVYAIELVDWFKEWLAEDEESWKQYREAVRRAGAEAPTSHKAVLSAMLLHEAAKLKVSRAEGDFERNISSLCGLSRNNCKAILSELHSSGYIRHDEGRQVYTFWPLGESGDKVEKPLREETEAVFRDPALLRSTLEESIKHWGWEAIEVGGMPGHPQDWAAEVWLMPRILFSAERLKRLAETYHLHKNHGLVEGKRGYIVRPIASSEDELAWLRANATKILDESLKDYGDAPPPVVVELPMHAQPNLVKSLVRQRVLSDWNAEKRREVGAQAFTEVLKRVETDVETELNSFSAEDFVVPLAYRAALQASRIEGQRRNTENILRDCYLQAYRYSPPGFFKNYKRDTNANLKNAVSMACAYLMRGSMSGYEMAAKNKGTARELYNQFLAGGTGREQWGLVMPNGRVQEPQTSRLREAWKVLEETIPPGSDSIPIKNALVKLLNAPFGYDYNTLSLLFCAWIGANHHQLTLTSDSGRSITLEECFPDKADSKKFLETVCWTRDVHVARRDTVRETEEVDRLIRRIRLEEPFSLEEAESAHHKLETYAKNDGADPARLQLVNNAVTQLAHEIKLATDYKTTMEKLAVDVQSATNFMGAIKVLNAIGSPPPLGAVKPSNQAAPGELREAARAKLRQLTDLTCDRLEHLSSIQSYELQKTRLIAVKAELEKAGEPEFTGRVDESLSRLDARLEELTSESKDAEFISSVRAMKGEKRLVALRANLFQLNGYQSHSEKTRALIEATRPDIEAAIADAISWLESLELRLAEAVSATDVRKIIGEVHRRLDRYEGTAEYDALNEIHKRYESLEKYFERLAELRRERPENTKELVKITRRIDALIEDDSLSEAQRVLAKDIRTSLEERTQADIEAAIHWLGECTNRNATNDDPIQLQTDLEKGSPFLPDEYTTRLRALKREVQKRIDADEVIRVEASFRKIKDKAKRTECLQILQAIVNEG